MHPRAHPILKEYETLKVDIELRDNEGDTLIITENHKDGIGRSFTMSHQKQMGEILIRGPIRIFC